MNAGGMRYKQRTKALGIPVPGYRDRIWPELELQKFQIIENMLLAGMRGELNAVFDEGQMVLRRGENGKYRVVLSANGASPSVHGTVGGAYFIASSTVAWEDLDDGTTYFLYLRGSPETFSDPSAVRPIASERRLLDKGSVLMAIVDLRADKPSMDRNPDGKVNARDLIRHVQDYDNPHGYKAIQDELLVRKALVFESDATIEVGEEPGAVVIPAKQIAEALQAMTRTTRKVVDFVTAGPEGIVLEGGGRVTFVLVSRRSEGTISGEAGEVAVGYFGSDSQASRPDQFVVRNTGASGIQMRALVING